jgi:hypothetical protein
MSEIGSLIIKLQADTAQFKKDLGKVKSQLGEVGEEGKKSGNHIKEGMFNARSAIQIAGHELGFSIPQHLQTMTARIPIVSAMFSSMLPVFGIAAAATAIGGVIKVLKESKEAAEQLKQGFENTGNSIREKSDELQLSIAKSADEIAKLTGKHTNGARVALWEARVEADKLADSLKKDLADLISLMAKASSYHLLTDLMGGSDASQAADVAKGLQDALAKIPHDSHFAENYQKALVAAHQRAQYEIEQNNKQAAPSFDPESGTTLPGRDVTKANQTLYNLQNHLSELHNEMQMVGKDDSLKHQVSNLKDTAAAADKAHAAFKKMLEDYQKQLDLVNKAREAREKLSGEERDATNAYMDMMRRQNESDTALQSAQYRSDEENYILSLQSKEDALKSRLALGKTTARDYTNEMIALAQKERNAKAAIIQSEIDDQKRLAKAAGAEGNTTAKNTALTKVMDLEQRKQQIIGQSEAKMAALRLQYAQKLQKDNEQKLKTLTNAFRSSYSQMMDGQHRLGDVMAGMWRNVGQAAAESMLKTWGMFLMMNAAQRSAMLAEKNATAGSAAGHAYDAVVRIPFVGPVIAPGVAAIAYGAVMAFEKGGEIPGSGPVPIIGHGGETVVTKALTDQVAAANGKGSKGHTFHFAPVIHAIDANGVDTMLQHHEHVFVKRMNSWARRMNK